MKTLETLSTLTTLLSALEAILQHAYDPALTMLAEALVEERRVLLCGTPWLAMHMAALLVSGDRKPYAGIALTDSAVITAVQVPHHLLSRQVEAYGASGDVLVAFGGGRTVLEAIAAAKRIGMGTLGLSGLTLLGCDVDIGVPSSVPARVHELHLVVVHLLIEGLEERLPR